MSILVTCEVTSGPGSIQKIWLSSGQSISIGRDDTADYAFRQDSQMSTNHFRLACAEDACTLEDLGSSNGTFLNGSRVTRERVNDSDTIETGSTSFRVKVEAQRKAGATDPDRKPVVPSNEQPEPVGSPEPVEPIVQPSNLNYSPRDSMMAALSKRSNGVDVEPSSSGISENLTRPTPNTESSTGLATQDIPNLGTTLSPTIMGLLKILKKSREQDSPPPIGAMLAVLNSSGDDISSTAAADDASGPAETRETTSWKPGAKLQIAVERADRSTELVSLRVGQVLTVGKAAECDLTITGDDSLADKQFLISCNEGKSMLFDFGSGIATFVNGTEVGQHELSNGDTINVGESLIRVQCDGGHEPQRERVMIP